LEWIHIAGFCCAALIGAVIGFLGGGGAILAVPVFVYLMGIEAVQATAYSLFLVGITSGIASYRYYRQGLIAFKAIIPFVIPSVIFLYFTRRFLLPAIPDPLIESDQFELSRKTFMMLLFSLLMITAALSMLTKRADRPTHTKLPAGFRPFLISMWGTVVGLLAGIVGAGGGFMIIPVMVLFLGLEMKVAVGTSLAIICIQSLTGFAGDLSTHLDIDWQFLLPFTAISVAGMLAGSGLSKKLEPAKIRRIFGVFILSMGLVIIVSEFF
jgi:uncharacterized membrane protein YfcA